MADAHKNFAYSTVATAPSPAASGVTLDVAAGEGAKFPTVPFNATVWPTGVQPLSSNAEIVRVTLIVGDTLTLTRTQESTSARSIVVGDQIAATVTAKTLTDIEAASASPTDATTTAIGTQNDFAPGLTFVTGQVATLRCNNASLLTITGLAGGVAGAYLDIVSVGAGQVDLPHQNAGSVAGNRLLNMVTSFQTSLAPGTGVARYLFDGTTSRWRLVSHAQGSPIDWSASSTITGWASFTAKIFRYILNDKKVQYWWAFQGTSNSTSVTFTTPFAHSNAAADGSEDMINVFTEDNGAQVASSTRTQFSTSTQLQSFKDMGTTGFTASGTKIVRGGGEADVD